MTDCPYGRTYRTGCKCEVCRAVVAQYMSNWRRRKAERVWGKSHPSDLVSPERCEKLIWDAYSVKGMTIADISRITTLKKQTISSLFHGDRKYVTRATEEKIAGALDRDHVTRVHEPMTLVDAAPHKWILYALHAQGWRERDIELILKRNGKHTGFVRHVKDGRGQIQWRTAQALQWLAEYIGDRKGPSRQTAAAMRKRGYFPLIHYSETGNLLVSSLTPEQRQFIQRL